MGQGGLTLEINLRDAVTEQLKGMGRSFEAMRQVVVSLRADIGALNKDADKSSLGFEALFKGAGGLLGNMGKDALEGLSAAFGQSGKMAADYHAVRRRESEETARQEGENAAKATDQGSLLEASFRQYADYYAAILEKEKRHGEERLTLLLEHSRAEMEVRASTARSTDDLRKQQLEEDKKADAARLENMKSFTGDMASAMKELYSTGLAESRGVYNMFQALSVAETTISTYKAAQEAYAKGVQMGGVVIGAVWAAAAVAAGMGRIAAIRNTKPKGYAFGGLIGGADRGERADNVLIRATPGEYMLDRPAVRHYGLPLLEALRRRNIPREVLEPFTAPRLPHVGGRAAYAYGGEIGTASLPGGGEKPDAEGITVINVMDFQREFDRALSSARGRRLLVNVLGEEGITA